MKNGEDEKFYTNGAAWDAMIDTLARIEGKVTEFDHFYRAGLEKLDHLDKTFRELDSTMKGIDSTIKTSVMEFAKQAAGIVPGGLIPVRSALLMVVVALGIAKASDIGEHVTHIIHAVMGVQ